MGFVVGAFVYNRGGASQGDKAWNACWGGDAEGDQSPAAQYPVFFRRGFGLGWWYWWYAVGLCGVKDGGEWLAVGGVTGRGSEGDVLALGAVNRL